MMDSFRTGLVDVGVEWRAYMRRIPWMRATFIRAGPPRACPALVCRGEGELITAVVGDSRVRLPRRFAHLAAVGLNDCLVHLARERAALALPAPVVGEALHRPGDVDLPAGASR